MSLITESGREKFKENDALYLSIDHLDKGTYYLKILLKDKVIKSIKITK